MASAFGHAVAALAIGSSFKQVIQDWKFWILGMFCAIIPDADVVSFSIGIPYESIWGHRGFTHSFLFALVLGVAITMLFYNSAFFSKKGLWLTTFFTLCTASHPILDAMTTGGLGVAFFFPFDNARYFFPFRPIQVSPIGVDRFFGPKGIAVLKSELVWIGIPSFLYVLGSVFFKRVFKSSR